MRIAPQIRVALVFAAVASVEQAMAALPAASESARASAAEAAAKAAWSDKVGAYQLCLTTDRIAATYRRNLQASGKAVPTPVATASCSDPGPYVSPIPVAAKPIEASEAHSPPGTTTGPPSTNATAAELQGAKK